MSDANSLAVSAQSFAKNDFQILIAEMREQNFDSIRFATYRTACKLRFAQKKANLHLVDIWNIIESFRENGLNVVESGTEVKISRIELLLSTIYHNLNKRLPAAQQIDTDKSIGLLLSFLLGAYDREDSGRLRVFSIKVALATLCAGKLLDKLRYIFSQISDSSGLMDNTKFVDYLREVLSLATAVFEGPTFGFSGVAIGQCFAPNSKVTVNQFLDNLMTDPCPPCLMWLPLLHRMSSVEHVYHPVVCDACGVEAFTGFRYKCQRCTNYQLCQECFWRGRTSATHSNQHEMKEYSSYKSPTKQLGHSLQKSLRCVPLTQSTTRPIFPEHPDRPLDLTNVVPISPSLAASQLAALTDRNQSGNNLPGGLYDSWSILDQDLGQFPFSDMPGMDDEHKLIARYCAKLAGRTTYPPINPRQNLNQIGDESLAQRTMIAQLEQQNREIMREITQLQAMETAVTSNYNVPRHLSESGLNAELETLRDRKQELELRMQQMQETRRELMGQLEHLMRVLKTNQPVNSREGSPQSLSGIGGEVRSAFRDSTPVAGLGQSPMMSTSLTRAGSLPAGIPPKTGSLQGDLLYAADDITKNMSTLVRELDEAEAEEETDADEQMRRLSDGNGYAQHLNGTK